MISHDAKGAALLRQGHDLIEYLYGPRAAIEQITYKNQLAFRGAFASAELKQFEQLLQFLKTAVDIRDNVE